MLPFTSAVILAAGKATRMGSQKLLLPLGEQTIIEKVADAVLSSKVDEVIIVLGYKSQGVADALGKRILKFVVNKDYALGQSTSLVAGIKSVNPKAKAVVLVLGDQPMINSSLIDTLIDFHFTSGKLATRPVCKGKPGHPVIIDSSLIPDLLSLQGDTGAKEVIAHVDGGIACMEVENHYLLQDVDTVGAYNEMIKALQADKC